MEGSRIEPFGKITFQKLKSQVRPFFEVVDILHFRWQSRERFEGGRCQFRTVFSC